MNEPIEPAKEDCCNSGCNPCIFDVYEKQLKLYKQYKARGHVSSEDNILLDNTMSQLSYTQFTVVDNIKMCVGHHLIIFKVKTNDNNPKIMWKPGNHFLVKYTSGDYACSRAYTPLRLNTKSVSEFSIVVKRYDEGLVSQHLCGLKSDQITLWRGPFGHYDIITNKYNRIIMIAQGTGLAPFLSIIEHILNNDEDMTKLILFYCCRNMETILFRDILHSWKQYWNFSYSIYLSDNKHDVIKYQEPVVMEKFETEKLLPLMPLTVNDQILLCGSADFMDHYNQFFKLEKCENVVLF